MKVIKKQGASYTDKNNQQRYYDNYYLVLDNGTRIAIRCSFSNDYAKLSTIAEFE